MSRDEHTEKTEELLKKLTDEIKDMVKKMSGGDKEKMNRLLMSSIGSYVQVVLEWALYEGPGGLGLPADLCSYIVGVNTPTGMIVGSKAKNAAERRGMMELMFDAVKREDDESVSQHAHIRDSCNCSMCQESRVEKKNPDEPHGKDHFTFHNPPTEN